MHNSKFQAFILKISVHAIFRLIGSVEKIAFQHVYLGVLYDQFYFFPEELWNLDA